jgi:deoxyribodipyrimidine photo-lyase
MGTAEPSALVWFRRDLRAADHAALYHALKSHARVHCAFVLDTQILDRLPRRDRRVEFIRECLLELDESLRSLAGHAQAGLIVLHGPAREEIPRLATRLGVQSVLTNHDYEPAARADPRGRGGRARADVGG